jgi:hypothetical protein
MKILKRIIISILFFSLIISCEEKHIDTNQYKELEDIFKHKYEYNPAIISNYESVIEQIKLDATPLVQSNITSKFGKVFILEDSLHNQIFQKVNNDSNIIECVIWMIKPTGTEPLLLVAYQNKIYPMDYIRKLIRDKDYDNLTYRSQIAIIPILRIFKEGVQLNDINTYKTKEEYKENLIAKYRNVIYIEKDWIEDDYFMRIKLFVKQNNRDNSKSNI